MIVLCGRAAGEGREATKDHQSDDAKGLFLDGDLTATGRNEGGSGSHVDDGEERTKYEWMINEYEDVLKSSESSREQW